MDAYYRSDLKPGMVHRGCSTHPPGQTINQTYSTMKTQAKLWVLYALFIITLLITVTCGAQSAENSIKINRAPGVEQSHTVIASSTDIGTIADIATSMIEARQMSTIGVQDSIFVVSYVNNEYFVTFHDRTGMDWEEVQDKIISMIGSEDTKFLYRSTRVSEVRKWLRDEIITLYGQ